MGGAQKGNPLGNKIHEESQFQQAGGSGQR